MRRPYSASDNTPGWTLTDVHNVGRTGFVKYRDVSALEFWFVVFLLWGWVDDDSNEDTYDAGHNRRYAEGDLKSSLMGRIFRNQITKAAESGCPYGNTFDLGDLRAESSCFPFIPALIWNTRNTAYNFAYLFEETKNEDDVFLWEIGKLQFGWKPDIPVGDVPYWKMIIGYNF